MDTKKLRQKILDLAIRGKLVPQDPNDEPASVLLERIKAEKERLIKEGKIKRSKKSASDTSHYENWPFEIPENWTWCRVDDFAYVASGSTPSKDAFVEKGIPYIKMYNLRKQHIDFFFHPQYIKPEVHNGKLQRSRTEIGDLIMNIVGPPLGKLAIIPSDLPESNFNQAAVLIRPYMYKEILVHYLFYYLSEMSEINSISTKGSAGQVNISLTQSQNMRIALPPLNEQVRIVEEVRKWFTYVNAIDNNSCELEELIGNTKQNILRMAIQGQLVKQNPSDEPAIELLKRINSDIQIPCDNPHYAELPESWCCCKMKDLGLIYSGGTPSTQKKEYWENGEIAWITPADLSGYTRVFITDGLKNITEIGLKKSSAQLFPQNSVMVSCRAPVGYVAISSKAMCTNQGFKTIAPYDIKLSLYLYYFCKANRADFESRATGTTFKELSKREFENTIVPIPPINEQQRIVAEIERYFNVLDQIKESLTA